MGEQRSRGKSVVARARTLALTRGPATLDELDTHAVKPAAYQLRWAWLPLDRIMWLCTGRTPTGFAPTTSVRMELADLVSLLPAAGYGDSLEETAG